MSEAPTQDFEHVEHAQHVAHLGSSFLTNVSITIAILAVIAASVGSLETIETAKSIGAKNEAVLLQNKATDNWNFYQAKSIKKNMYEIAAAATPEARESLSRQALRYQTDEKDLFAKGEALEQATEVKLRESENHEHRHEILTVAVTLLHVSIAIATISIIMAGRRWPWYSSIALGVAGSVTAFYAYL